MLAKPGRLMALRGQVPLPVEGGQYVSIFKAFRKMLHSHAALTLMGAFEERPFLRKSLSEAGNSSHW